jgi:hypothetical protein
MKSKLKIAIAVLVVIMVVVAAAALLTMKSGTSAIAAPTNLKATTTPLGIDLKWSNPYSNGTEYSGQAIYVRADNETTWHKVAELEGGAEGKFIPFTSANLAGGMTYHFKVMGETGSGDNISSDEIQVTPYFGPSAPTGLNATWGNGYVDLSWSSPVEDGGRPVTAYTVHRYQYNDTTKEAFDWRNYTLGPNATTFRDDNVTNGILYHYELSAENEIGEGYNCSDSIKPGSPSQPLNLTVTAGNGYVYLSWASPMITAGNETEYHIYRYNATSGEWKEIASVHTTFYNDTNVQANVTYTYKVTPDNTIGGEGESIESGTVKPS